MMRNNKDHAEIRKISKTIEKVKWFFFFLKVKNIHFLVRLRKTYKNEITY
jgi:hypothetical protein